METIGHIRKLELYLKKVQFEWCQNFSSV